jgi:hypothetical protein
MMRVRFNPILGYVLLVPAIFVLGTGLLLGKGMLLMIGAMNMMVAIGHLTGTVFEITDREIGIKNLLGMTMRRHAFGSFADLEVRGNQIYRRADGSPLKGVGKGLSHSGDWQALCDKITAAAR